MREIKFRAWYDGRMYKESMCEFLSGYGCMFNWFTKPDAPLMQYTGLKDKNGVEIYEGDIVRVCRDDDEFLSLDEVVQLPCGLWYLNTVENNSIYDIVQYEDKYVEVCGNIYENPELLEEK